jgi:hypothetical protein
MPLAFSLQYCPRCKSRVPFSAVTVSGIGAEHYVCPSCSAQLCRAVESRALLVPLYSSLAGALLIFLPLWLGVSVAAVLLVWLVRRAFALKVVANG